jgi:hypothetical protein
METKEGTIETERQGLDAGIPRVHGVDMGRNNKPVQPPVQGQTAESKTIMLENRPGLPSSSSHPSWPVNVQTEARSCDSSTSTVSRDPKSSSSGDEGEENEDSEEVNGSARAGRSKKKKLDRSKLRKGKWTVSKHNLVTLTFDDLAHLLTQINTSCAFALFSDRGRRIYFPHHTLLQHRADNSSGRSDSSLIHCRKVELRSHEGH